MGAISPIPFQVLPTRSSSEMAATIEWEADPVDLTSEDALRAAADDRTSNDDDRTERKEATLWLKQVLAGGRVPTKEMEELVRNSVFKLRTVERAKKT